MISPVIGGISYNAGEYQALPDDFVPYHFDDEVAVLPLLGRDGALLMNNEVLQTSARRAQSCTFAVLVQTSAGKVALEDLWATQTTHDLGDGDGARNVTVTKVDAQLLLWPGAAPIFKVTITTRTREGGGGA